MASQRPQYVYEENVRDQVAKLLERGFSGSIFTGKEALSCEEVAQVIYPVRGERVTEQKILYIRDLLQEFGYAYSSVFSPVSAWNEEQTEADKILEEVQVLLVNDQIEEAIELVQSHRTEQDSKFEKETDFFLAAIQLLGRESLRQEEEIWDEVDMYTDDAEQLRYWNDELRAAHARGATKEDYKYDMLSQWSIERRAKRGMPITDNDIARAEHAVGCYKKAAQIWQEEADRWRFAPCRQAPYMLSAAGKFRKNAEKFRERVESMNEKLDLLRTAKEMGTKLYASFYTAEKQAEEDAEIERRGNSQIVYLSDLEEEK